MSDALLFNPAAAATEELEAVFVARHALLAMLREELGEQHASPTTQHYLIVGPRGIGKTHLTELLSRQLAADPSRPWRTVRLPEENYGSRGLDELLAAIVDRDTDRDRSWDEAVPPVEASLAVLTRRQRETGRPLLVVLENLSRVLARTLRGEKEVRQLRAILMSSPPFTLMATATSYVEVVGREERPLYDFFRVITLQELAGDQIEAMARHRATWDGLEPGQIEQVIQRVRAISHLSGGNPRLVLALHAVVRAGATQDIQRQLLGLLDRVTAYYQARIDDLSAQQGMLLTRLALAPGPVAAATLARLSGLSTAHTTAILNVLLAGRLVRRVSAGHKKRSLYEVTDRLFRIWLEMRESRGARRRLRSLLDFYEMAYTAEERKSAYEPWTMLRIPSVELSHFEAYTLSLAHLVEVPGLRAGLLRGLAAILRDSDENDVHLPMLAQLFGEHALSPEEVAGIYEGLWQTCSLAPLEWTAATIARFAELTGVQPEPWQSFRKYVESGCDESFLLALHPEVREAVVLIRERHAGSSAEAPARRARTPGASRR